MATAKNLLSHSFCLTLFTNGDKCSIDGERSHDTLPLQKARQNSHDVEPFNLFIHSPSKRTILFKGTRCLGSVELIHEKCLKPFGCNLHMVRKMSNGRI